MFFFGSTGPRRRVRRTRRENAASTTAVRRREPCACRRRRGATLPRSVTVGDRLAQKSDRHRPLSLRPVSLRRRIYMQFLLIVLSCRRWLWWRGLCRYRHHRRHLCNSAYRNNRTRAVVTKILENSRRALLRCYIFRIFLLLSLIFIPFPPPAAAAAASRRSDRIILRREIKPIINYF